MEKVVEKLKKILAARGSGGIVSLGIQFRVYNININIIIYYICRLLIKTRIENLNQMNFIMQ